MIEIITASGVSLDLDPSTEFEIEMENPMLSDSHIPVAFSTSISFLPTPKNKNAFGYMAAMLQEPTEKVVEVVISCKGIHLFNGRLEYEGVEDGLINYTFTEKNLEPEWSKSIHTSNSLTNFISFPSRALPSNYMRLEAIQRGEFYDGSGMWDPGGTLYQDFELPMIVAKQSVAEVEYSNNNIGKTSVSPDVKYHNYFWRLTHAPISPAVKVVNILQNTKNMLVISPEISDKIGNLSIVGLYHSRPISRLGLQQTEGGMLVLPIADMLPECSLLDFVTNLAKMYCASVFRDGDHFVMLTNKEVLTSQNTLVWDDKIQNNYILGWEPESSYTFAFANDGNNELINNTEALREDTEKDIKDVVGAETVIDTLINAGSAYIAVKDHRTGDMFSGKSMNIGDRKSCYHDMLTHHNNKVVINEGADSSYDNSVMFKCVECIPLHTLCYDNTNSSKSAYHMCPIIEIPKPGGQRPTDVWIGMLINGQLVGKGVAFARQQADGLHADIENKIGHFNPNLSLSVDSLFRRYHSLFSSWLATKRKIVTIDIQLSLSEVSALRMYDKVCVNNQIFLIKKITHTFSGKDGTVKSRVDLISCENFTDTTDVINIIQVEYWGTTVNDTQFQAVSRHPVNSDVLIPVTYGDWTSGTMVNSNTILKIPKGGQKSLIQKGYPNGVSLVAPYEDIKYIYMGATLKYIQK